MNEFKREERYIVVKIKDLKYQSAVNKLHQILSDAGIPTRECVVVESDWPEYETVWKMIQARVEGKPIECEAPQAVDGLKNLSIDQIISAARLHLVSGFEASEVIGFARSLQMTTPILQRYREAFEVMAYLGIFNTDAESLMRKIEAGDFAQEYQFLKGGPAQSLPEVKE